MAAVLAPIPIDATSTVFAEAVVRIEAGRERVILTRDGKPVAAMVPLSDLEAIEDAEDRAAAAAALMDHEQSGQAWPAYTAAQLAAKWGIDPSDSAAE